jgi:hypothetical protein
LSEIQSHRNYAPVADVRRQVDADLAHQLREPLERLRDRRAQRHRNAASIATASQHRRQQMVPNEAGRAGEQRARRV